MSLMNQILKNQQTGNIGMKDAMHRSIPGAERYEPVLQKDGSYGALPFIVDPTQPVPVTDRNQAREMLNPSRETQRTFGGRMLTYGSGGAGGRSGGGGGGGGGRMRPQDPNKRIGQRLGPRTTQEYAAENGGLGPQRTSALDAAYRDGNLSQPGMPRPGSTPPDGVTPLGMGDISGASVGNATGQMFNDALTQPKPMAKGGTMKPNGVYTVGEKGPEMVVPTGDGNMHVIPHGATKKLLSMLPGRPTPRAEGGVMRSEDGQVGLLNSEYGTGYADNRSQSTPLPGLPSVMSDERGMIQPGALPGAGTMPYMPDPVSGPWASRDGVMPGMDRVPLRRGIEEAQNVVRGSDIPLMPATDSELVPDGRTGEYVPLSMMKQRVADRAIDFNNELFDVRDRAERNRVQQELAMRAERPALGTPTAPATGLPGMPTMRPSTMRNVERQMERFYNTPQGAMYATEQAQQAGQSQQRMQAATTALPIRDANGNILGYTNGLGASLPNPQGTSRQVRRQAEVNGQWMNFFDDGSVEPVAVPGGNAANQPVLAWDGSKVVTLPADTDVANLPYGLTPLPSRGKTTETGGAKMDPAKPAGTAQAPVKAATAADWAKLPAGTQYMAPNGQIYTKK